MKPGRKPDPDCDTCQGVGSLTSWAKTVPITIACPTCVTPWGKVPGQRRI